MRGIAWPKSGHPLIVETCWKPTFSVSCLQCESTGLHASHTQYRLIDPPHKGGHFSVDVKHILLKQAKVEPGYGKGSSHLGTNVRSTSTDETGQNPIYCQGSSTVSLSNLFNGVLWNIGFSSLGSFLSRCRLHKACPGCRRVRFPPHLPRTQLRQRSEPWLEMRLSFALAISKLMPQSKE